ncbi:MAG: 2-oxoacid:acceptor oxidoreductase family protein [Candidatus Schekmanbacteria bacterium]|nr:2-oxoacid:acceptor oxidoreductase family protein [Candidatus Schekmanbacteria bacterium]
MKKQAHQEAKAVAKAPKYPGAPAAMDGTAAVVEMETAGGEAAGAYPITPATQMGEGWALAVAQGKKNVFGRRLLFFEPEGEHAAAAVTAGMSMMGLRAANFSAAQGIAYMHESLYAAVGKRLTYVLNIACRAMTKQSLNIHCAHDDYHAVEDTGFFQIFAKDVQESADLNLIAHRIAELSLTPGIIAQDGFLTSHVIETLNLPERDLVREYLGDPADLIETPTAAQRLIFGDKRRRIPEIFDFDHPAMIGTVQNQDSYAQGVAAQRPFFFDHIEKLADRAFAEYGELTGRHYARAMGYRLDDAEYALIGQGSFVSNAEAACDYLRKSRGLKIGVLNLTMFRPFPLDHVTRLLAGKRAAACLERVDQPLAVDGPLLREVRAALSKGMENSRSGNGARPFPSAATIAPEQIPELYSGCYGLGSRDLQPGDIIAAVDNMLPTGGHRRSFYLGIDFVRDAKQLPDGELPGWQEKILADYPHVSDLALKATEDANLMPADALSLRIHSVGGWGAVTMGKNVTMTLFDLLGLHVKSNPKYGSEKKGQPTTFYATFSREKIRLNCDLLHVSVVLSPDPNVFRHSNPLMGLAEGGVFIIQSDLDQQGFWSGLPGWARQIVREKQLRVFIIDAFAIARGEATDVELQFRMQGNAFQGAFFRGSPLMGREKLDEKELFEAIRSQLAKKFGHRGAHIVEDNYRVIRRGYEELREVDWRALQDRDTPAKRATMPWFIRAAETAQGIGDPNRFYDQVCALYKAGSDPIADPYAAFSAIPAATGVFRDMTGIRFEVPSFVAENCTGCGQCWTQCPDAAIPGLVTDIEDLIRVTARAAAEGGEQPRELLDAARPLADKARELVKAGKLDSAGPVLDAAREAVLPALGLGADAQQRFDAQFQQVRGRLAAFPLAKTAPFFSVPEAKHAGSGGLLSVTVNPYACKGCMLCVEVCPDHALVAVRQTDEIVERLRSNWDLWHRLPETPDRFIQIRDLDEGIGVLHTMLLKKQVYQSMVGGDGACMGCGEKTCVHLVTSAIEAAMQPRVVRFVDKLDGLVRQLEDKARLLLASGADLDVLATGSGQHFDLPISDATRARLTTVTGLLRTLKDLRWRYASGPTGKGRAALGITNSTGCSSVWASSYPYNPYPFPWANHLFQDSPSLAIGIFEGQMRKMADAFTAVRKAELEIADSYDPKVHNEFFSAFTWEELTDEEFRLCPPILAIGGDGAMYDIGFQNLSRLLASGKPVRVLVLDTQVYSNTGGQACTSGFTGQVSDMAAYGGAQRGKREQRKELSFIELAHRGAYVLQSSQASAAHLLGGVLRGLNARVPAVFNIYTPCQAEHGIADCASEHAARLALESRAYPFLIYDPGAGPSITDKLDLTGNPSIDQRWPTYTMTYVDDQGREQSMEVPVTTADWAATEARFAKHFQPLKPGTDAARLVHLDAFLDLPEAEREQKIPFIYSLGANRKLDRLRVSPEIVTLTEERLNYWQDLKEMSGIEVPKRVRSQVTTELEDDFGARLSALKAEYESKIAELKATYPRQLAQRIAEALVRPGGQVDAESLLSSAGAARVSPPRGPAVAGEGAAPTAGGNGKSEAASVAAPVAIAEREAEPEVVEGPYIDTEMCTTCNECTTINPKMFAYNSDRKAVIKDPAAGTYKDLVTAAERCPAGIIHPGEPLNPRERDLDKWRKRAEAFK